MRDLPAPALVSRAVNRSATPGGSVRLSPPPPRAECGAGGGDGLGGNGAVRGQGRPGAHQCRLVVSPGSKTGVGGPFVSPLTVGQRRLTVCRKGPAGEIPLRP